MGKKQGRAKPKKHHGWTTEEQHKFLVSHVPGYLSAKARPGQTGFEEFWPPVYTEWFKQWPLPDLTQDQVNNGVDQDKQLATQKLVSDVS
jgi:hypothetical protein